MIPAGAIRAIEVVHPCYEVVAVQQLEARPKRFLSNSALGGQPFRPTRLRWPRKARGLQHRR